MRRLLLILVAAATVATAGLALEARAPSTADAHPGRTDSAGCHTCRTNCASWGLLSEGSSVRVSRVGTGPCAAWSIVQSGRVFSWVRNEYLR